MAGNDAIWLRGEPGPHTGITIVDASATRFVYEKGGARHEVESWRVRSVRRGDAPAELENALSLVPAAELETAEKMLGELESRAEPKWLAAHAGFLRANVARLRAEYETGVGAPCESAWKTLRAWREKNKDHYLAPAAALAAGEAALGAQNGTATLDAARAEFEALGAEPFAKTPWALLSRWGLAQVAMRTKPDEALAAFEKLEADALADEWGHEPAQLARIGRAQALASLGRHAEGALLLAEVVDLDPWSGTPARARALNVLADIATSMGGGATKPEGLLAAYPFWMRVVRYVALDPIERPRALAGAYRASVAAGATERAEHFKRELATRYAGSRWTKTL